MGWIAPTVYFCLFVWTFFFLHAVFSVPLILNSFSYSIPARARCAAFWLLPHLAKSGLRCWLVGDLDTVLRFLRTWAMAWPWWQQWQLWIEAQCWTAWCPGNLCWKQRETFLMCLKWLSLESLSSTKLKFLKLTFFNNLNQFSDLSLAKKGWFLILGELVLACSSLWKFTYNFKYRWKIVFF